jgi:RNA polymerase sigma factor (sigma-70 family)
VSKSATGAITRAELEALYRSYGPLVRRRARGILGDDLEAQDAVQEVFVRVLRSAGEFRGQSQPSTWLYRIATNLCLNRVRDGRRRREHLDRFGEEVHHATPAAAPSADTRATLRRVLAEVPQELAEIAIYYWVDEMDQAEIAEILGLSRRTVGNRLERFRAEALRVLGDGARVAIAPPAGVPKAEEETS